MRERAEEPVVEKQARVVEEVKVGKKRSKNVQTVEDTVRKTDVEVERVGSAGQAAYQGRSGAATPPPTPGRIAARWRNGRRAEDGRGLRPAAEACRTAHGVGRRCGSAALGTAAAVYFH